MLGIYLSSQYSQKEHTRKFAGKLTTIPQVLITSRWIMETHDPQMTMDQLSEQELVRTAIDDFQDVMNSDVMVFYSQDPLTCTPRGGRHVEFGIALATNCLICVIGPKENIFHYLSIPDMIRHFETEQECYLFLKELSEKG